MCWQELYNEWAVIFSLCLRGRVITASGLKNLTAVSSRPVSACSLSPGNTVASVIHCWYFSTEMGLHLRTPKGDPSVTAKCCSSQPGLRSGGVRRARLLMTHQRPFKSYSERLCKGQGWEQKPLWYKSTTTLMHINLWHKKPLSSMKKSLSRNHQSQKPCL